MSKEKELLKNTAIISFGKIATQLVSFFLLPLYTSVLSTREYGVLDLVITYSSLLLPFATLALEQALFRFLIDVRNDIFKCRKYISTTIIVSGGISFVIFSVLVVGYLYTSNLLLIYFGLVLLSSIASAIALQISRGLGDNIGYTMGSTLSAIVQVICNVAFLTVLKFGAIGMMLAIFIGNIVCVLVLFSRCGFKNYIELKDFDKETFKELLRYSLPLIPNQLSWWALNASDKIIVQFMIGVMGNGILAISTKFSGVYIQFSNIFNVSWTESVSLHINDDDAQEFIANTIDTVYRLFLCACCGIIAFIPFVFPIMINKQYQEAFGLIPIFMLASLFNVIVSLYGVIYVAKKKTVEIAKTAIYAASINIFSHLILINFVGIYAAALSTMIGYGCMAVYRYYHSRKYVVVRLKKITVFYTLCLITISFLAYYNGNRTWQIIGFAVICTCSVIINRNTMIGLIDVIKKKRRRNERSV